MGNSQGGVNHQRVIQVPKLRLISQASVRRSALKIDTSSEWNSVLDHILQPNL